MKTYVDKAALQEFTTKLTNKYKTMFSSPLVASTAADMTDTDKIYVYTGSESGYTNGNWYYYNGTEWTSGGVYNAVAVETDTTLSISGKAADGKVTGDKISKQINFTNKIYNDIFQSIELRNRAIINGWRLVPETGLCISNSQYSIVKYPVTAGDIIKVVSDDYVQFQSVASVPSTGTSNRVGDTYSNFNGYIEVPYGATYIVFSKATNSGTGIAYSVEDKKLDMVNKTYDIKKSNLKSGSLQTAYMQVDAAQIAAVAYLTKIPVMAGELIVINVEELTGITYKYRLGFYDSNGAYLSQITTQVNNYFTVPSSCAYFSIGIFAYDSTTGEYLTDYNLYNHLSSGEVISIIYVDEWKNDYVDTDDVKRMIEAAFNEDTGIVALNSDVKDKLLQAKRPMNLSSNAYLSNPQPVVLLQFSDIHGDATELQRMIDFSSEYSDMIDDVICTGDVVYDRWSSDFNYWGDVDGAENVLLAIGNHDVLTATSGYDWTQRATQAEQYARYIEPFYSNWDCEIESGKTYYYKDYSAKGVRLIVLNCMLTDTDNTEQLAWLETVLSDAKTNNLSVIVANHYMIANPEKIACNFSTLDRPVGTDVLPLAYLTAIQDFIDDDGKFICHIAGHTHWDMVVKSTTYPNQICVVVDALSRVQGNQWSDTQRTDGTRSQDLANLIAFDTSSGVVKVMRIGANKDHYLRNKEFISIRYTTGEIITQG